MSARRFLGLSEPTWRILLTGVTTAIWILVVWQVPLWANDCSLYLQNPQNFTGNMRGLIEDCMRTGYAQAVTTIILGGVGGAVIVKGVGPILKGRDDTFTLPPDSPGGEKKSGETPEGPPPISNRENAPEQCRVLWDEYKKATEAEFQKGKDVATVNNWYDHVFSNHMQNIARVTMQLGMDAADLASAGVGGVKGGMGVAKAVAHIPEAIAAIETLLAKAIVRSGNLDTMIRTLGEGIAELLSKGRSFASAADDAGRLSARAEERIAELVAGAVSLGDVARYDELLRFARSVDSTLLERHMVSKGLIVAEEGLKEANRNHEKILTRKAALDNWATKERLAIQNEDARVFNAKHEELGRAREKMAEFRAKNATAAGEAHREWQGKMSEVGQAKRDLDEARRGAAHLGDVKKRLVVAEQEAGKARHLRNDAADHLRDAEAELKAFDDADRAKLGATRGERLEAAKQELAKAREAGNEAIQRKKQAQEALNEYEGKMREDPNSDTASNDDLLEWERLDNAEKAAEARYANAETAVQDWQAANPDARLPKDLDTEFIRAQNERTFIKKEHQEFRSKMQDEGKTSGFPEDQVAEQRRLQEIRNQAAAEARPFEEQIGAAQAKVDNAAPPTHKEILKHAAGDSAYSERGELRRKVQNAQEQYDHANKLHTDADGELAKVKQEMDELDIGGTGEPLDTLRYVEIHQQRYDALVKEQEALRVKYERLKSGHTGNEQEAAAFQRQIDQLEPELANWKEPDFETEAARRNPQKYAEWKEEQAGLDAVGASEAQIASLESKLSEARANLATIERKLAEQQQQTGGKSTAELEAERNRLLEKIRANEAETETARKEKQTQDQAKAKAERDKEQADTERREKEAEKAKREAEKRESDAEIERLKEEKRKAFQDHSEGHTPSGPAAIPHLMGQAGKQFLGDPGEWTPYAGSDAEAIAKQSHNLRQRFDAVMQASYDAKPEWYKSLNEAIKAPFKWAGNKLADAWHKGFGGQSPEEVAAALKHGDQRVHEMQEKLKKVQAEFDELRKQALDAKAKFDLCCTLHRPAAGSETN